MSLVLIGILPVVSSGLATDVQGTFVAHVIETVNCSTCPTPKQTITSPAADVTVPIGYGPNPDRARLDSINVRVTVPPVTSKAQLTYAPTFESGARVDFSAYGGSVPVDVGVSANFTIGEPNPAASPGGIVFAKGSITGGTLPRQTATAAAHSSVTVTAAGAGTVVEVSDDGSAHGYPPSTRRVASTRILAGAGYPSSSSDVTFGEVRVSTYYNFPTFPRFRSTPLPTNPLSFGSVYVGEKGGIGLDISNAGPADLKIESIELSDGFPDVAGLSVEVDYKGTLSFPYTIPPGTYRFINVYLEWIPAAGGIDLEQRVAELRITTNDPDRRTIVYPLRGKSLGQSSFRSGPSEPGEDISFGTVALGDTTTESLRLRNEGTSDLHISQIKVNTNTPGFTLDLGGATFPLTLHPFDSSAQNPEKFDLTITWKPESVTELGVNTFANLQVLTDDPANSNVVYQIKGRSANVTVKAFEELIIGWLFNVTDKPSSGRKATAPSLPGTETAELNIDPAVTKTLTAQVPAFLGGGSLQLGNFTGNMRVSLIPIPGDSQHKLVRIESGGLSAPTVQLPSGAYTGPNQLIFGAPEESGGTLDVATGNYAAYATATIFNDILPNGLKVQGNYSGVYNAQNGKISARSNSEDLFEARDRLLNIATRMRVLTADNVLIGGFIITGTEPKKVIIRGIGPSLSGVGVTLFDPTLELRQGSTLIASNDDWKQNESEVRATTIPPSHDRESAIVTTLQPGAYTAVLAGKNGATGVGVVEVYDLAKAADSKLANISSRGFVDTGNNVMIGGLIIGSPLVVSGVGVPQGGARALVRAIGPSLGDAGVPNSLQDPTLELRDSNGALVEANDNWRSNHEAEIAATTIPPTRNEEAAIVRTLPAGAYTAIVRGVGNTTGVAVVEVYNLQ